MESNFSTKFVNFFFPVALWNLSLRSLLLSNDESHIIHIHSNCKYIIQVEAYEKYVSRPLSDGPPPLPPIPVAPNPPLSSPSPPIDDDEEEYLLKVSYIFITIIYTIHFKTIINITPEPTAPIWRTKPTSKKSNSNTYIYPFLSLILLFLCVIFQIAA